ATRFCQRLALLKRHEQGEIFGIGDDEIEPAAQDIGAVFGAAGSPCLESLVRGGNGGCGFLGPEVADLGDDLPIGGVVYPEGAAVGGAKPLAIDIRAGLEQGWIVELQWHLQASHVVSILEVGKEV